MRKPIWLKTNITRNTKIVRNIVKNLNLSTVCEEARCPNKGECWSMKTAAFLIMGDTCTRSCRFCSVKSGKPEVLDSSEPERIAEAVKLLSLKHCVVTSVTRDDLEDSGANHFAKTVKAIKSKNPETTIEVLIPDFQEKELKIVLSEKPEILNHNLETVERLTPFIRDKRASYKKSLKVLKTAKKISPSIRTKSGIMVGLGETEKEVKKTMMDLRNVNCDFLTIGQYLQPTKKNIPVARYVLMEEFFSYKNFGKKIGFLYVASSPLVRSSYHPWEFFTKKHK